MPSGPPGAQANGRDCPHPPPKQARGSPQSTFNLEDMCSIVAASLICMSMHSPPPFSIGELLMVGRSESLGVRVAQ
jgi:hypothetical protein